MAPRPVVGGRCCPVSAGTGGRGRRRRRPRPPRPRLPLTETRWRQAKSRGGQEGRSERAKRFPGPPSAPYKALSSGGLKRKPSPWKAKRGPGYCHQKFCAAPSARGTNNQQPSAPRLVSPPLPPCGKGQSRERAKGSRAKEAILGGDSRRETPRSCRGRPGGGRAGRPSGSCEVR